MLVIRCLLLRHSRSSLMEKEIFMALAIVYSRASLGIEAPLVTVEVHISNTYAREEFRHQSYISPVAKGVVLGFGLQSYELAIQSFI